MREKSDVSQTKAARKAVITGGSSGIGKSIVEAFSDAGFATVSADICESDKIPGSFFPVDLTQKEQINTFCDRLITDIGAPDVLVCNAGRGIHERLTEGDPDTWEQIFRLNLFSALRLIRNLVPEMLKQGKGDVVLISSVSSNKPYPGGGIYTASKAALEAVAETLRLELQPTIRVTVIRPGVVGTNFFNAIINGEQTPESIGWGAISPDQVADVVLYAVTRPREIALNDLVIRPAAQPM